MNTKQIDYCIELARTLNFSRAAENFFVSQPTFSYQIRLLEEEVGFAIFERSGRGAALTPAGAQFTAFLTGMRQDLKRAVEQLRLVGDSPGLSRPPSEAQGSPPAKRKDDSTSSGMAESTALSASSPASTVSFRYSRPPVRFHPDMVNVYCYCVHKPRIFRRSLFPRITNRGTQTEVVRGYRRVYRV